MRWTYRNGIEAVNLGSAQLSVVCAFERSGLAIECPGAWGGRYREEVVVQAWDKQGLERAVV